MLKVAITGNIASGKSVTENVLLEKGYTVLDSDKITHKLLEDENMTKILTVAFKDYDIFENDRISRVKLGKIVFDNEELRRKLESIMHPLIKDEIELFFNQKEAEGLKMAFVAVPLLFEAKFEHLFDKIILIYAENNNRLSRLMKRNNLSEEDAMKRINSQMSQDEKVKLAHYVINCNSLFEMRCDLDKILKLL